MHFHTFISVLETIFLVSILTFPYKVLTSPLQFNNYTNPLDININFCDQELCKIQQIDGNHTYENHIGCNATKELAPQCGATANLVNMDEYFRLILDFHNNLRNIVAGGSLNNTASRMATMIWDQTLAGLATNSMVRCEPLIDKCRNTKAYPYAGQNFGSRGYQGPREDTRKSIRDMLEKWAETSTHVDQTVLHSFHIPTNKNDSGLTQFTTMIRDCNVACGCSAIEFIGSDGLEWFIMNCNYATTNFYGEQCYAYGSPGSGCQTGPHPIFKSLCSLQEIYDFC